MTHFRRLLVIVAALLVALPLGARTVGADCPPEKSRPRVIFAGFATGGFDHGLADVLAVLVLSGLRTGARDVDFVSYEELQVLLGIETTLQASGNASDVSGVAGALGVPFLFQVEFKQEQNPGEGPVRTATGTLLSLRDASVVRRAQQRLSPGDGAAPLTAKMNQLAADVTQGLACDLQGKRERPAVPALKAEVTPQEASPNATVHVRVTLTDESDGLVQPAKDVRIANRHGSKLLASTRYETNFFGVVETDLSVGSDPGDGAIEATFTDSSGRTTKSSPESFAYRVRRTTGDLQATAPEAELEVGAGATVAARLTHDGAPVAGATVSFAASGGGDTADAAVVTDADGNATTQYAAPSVNAVVDVTASAPAQAPAPGAPDLTASLTIVVDGGVTLNVNALDTVAGGTSDVTADLVVGGTAIPGADVTFTLSGDGALSDASAPTDDAGRAEVTWIAPSGTSTAVITAATVVDGRTYAGVVTIHGGPLGPAMTLRVFPGASPEFDYFKGTLLTAEFDNPHPVCELGTLAGVFGSGANCAVAPDSGSPSDAPVALQARADADHRISASVTRAQPTVGVVEFSGRNAGASGGVDEAVCIELGFGAAGTLDVTAEASSFPFLVCDAADLSSCGYWSVYAPKSGERFVSSDAKTALTVPATAASVDVPAPGVLQLVLRSGYYRSSAQALDFDGTWRFTFTFHPQ